MKNYGNAIKILRKRNSMTQAMLAEELNVSGQAVSKWENNMAQPDLDTLVKITEIFKITLDEFTKLCDADTVDATPAAEEKMTSTAGVRLIGVCSDCGSSIYDEEEVGSRIPKLTCKKCKQARIRRLEAEAESMLENRKIEERMFQAEMEAKEQRKKHFLRNSFLTPLWIMIPLFVLFVLAAPKGIFTILILFGLAYLSVVQIKWDNNLVADVFGSTFGKTFAQPGLIIPFSIDGFLWAIGVKIVMGIIWLLISIVVTAIGFLICMILSPFCFVPALMKIKNEKN